MNSSPKPLTGLEPLEWRSGPSEDDLVAAESLLGLVMTRRRATGAALRFRSARPARHKAGDILRIAGLPLPVAGDPALKEYREAIRQGTPLAPLLLVRDPASLRLLVAAGYHRLCAVYLFSANAEISCLIANSGS